MLLAFNKPMNVLSQFTDEGKWPLQVVLRELIVSLDKAAFLGSISFLQYSSTTTQIDIKALRAGMIILAIAPVLIFYPFVLKHFTRGTMTGSIKG